MLNAKRIDLSIFPERSDRPNLGLQFFAEPAPAPEPPPAAAPEPTHTEPTPEPATNDAAQKEELEKLKEENKRLKAANDNLSNENAKKTKVIRSLQSEEERKAAEKEEALQAAMEENKKFKKRFAVSEAAKKIMSFVGNETVADNVAGYLYGAEDVDAAIDAINKAWAAKEKELRLEFSRIPPPAAGGDNDKTQKDVEEGHKFGKAKMASTQSSNEGLKRFMK